MAERLEKLWPAVSERLDGLYLNFETGSGPDLLEFRARHSPALKSSRRTTIQANCFGANFPLPPARDEAALQAVMPGVLACHSLRRPLS